MPVRAPRLVLGIAAAVTATGVAAWQLQGGGGAAQGAPPTTTATRGDVVVTVRGVGRIVEARPAAQSVPAALAASAATSTPASTGAATGGSTPVPTGAVFPQTSGRVSRLLAAPGRQVQTGTPLAVLDDGGVAAAAFEQARIDLRTAQLELRQKRTHDPLLGLPPSPTELAAGRQGVVSARARLAQLLGRPRPADVSAARLDARKAEADLQTLLGGDRATRARAVVVAQDELRAAQAKLDKLLAPPAPADVSAATLDVRKAESDLAALLAPPLPETLAAARQAVDAARVKLDALLASPDATPSEIAAARHELAVALSDLATLTRPPAPQAVVSAQQAVDAARLKLAQLLGPPSPADVTVARADLERARAEVRRLRAGPSAIALGAARQGIRAARARLAQLLGPPLAADLTSARLDVRRARADLAVLRARGGPASATDIGLARLKVVAARAHLAVARFAESQLTVHAPFGGTVTGVLTATGSPVDASVPIVAIADLQHLEVTVDLSEFDASQVMPGQPATVSVDALGGRSVNAKVLFVALTGTDNGGVVTFPVRVTFDRLPGVRPGMNVSVHITVAKQRNVVHVPLEAVSRDGGNDGTVTVVDASGKTAERPVKLGLASNKDVAIASGLRAGEHVVLEGSQGG